MVDEVTVPAQYGDSVDIGKSDEFIMLQMVLNDDQSTQAYIYLSRDQAVQLIAQVAARL